MYIKSVTKRKAKSNDIFLKLGLIVIKWWLILYKQKPTNKISKKLISPSVGLNAQSNESSAKNEKPKKSEINSFE